MLLNKRRVIRITVSCNCKGSLGMIDDRRRQDWNPPTMSYNVLVLSLWRLSLKRVLITRLDPNDSSARRAHCQLDSRAMTGSATCSLTLRRSAEKDRELSWDRKISSFKLRLHGVCKESLPRCERIGRPEIRNATLIYMCLLVYDEHTTVKISSCS